MHTITKKQREVLENIKDYIKNRNVSPTIEELMKMQGASSSRTVTQYLDALEKKGYLFRFKNKRRNIEITGGAENFFGDTITLPVVGAAACGSLNVYAEESFNEFIQVARSFLGKNTRSEVIVIRALGYSMQDAGINDGDLALIELTDEVKTNDIVAAIIDGMAVIKKISLTENAVILNPVSSLGFYKQIVMKRDFKVLGKLLHVIKATSHEEIEIVPVSSY